MSEFKLQNDPMQGNLFDGVKSVGKPVTCLGQTFLDEAARRAHFTALLAEKLKDPAFRAIEGFPIGKDEDILALSDPPYYCACPNPWIGDFIREWEAAKPKRRGKYEREPFAADVSEGKNDPIYNAHSYHTKVPHKAIMRYILHYTEPGDIVFDGFCGSGMTGVGAFMCGDKSQVEEIGFKVDDKTGNVLSKAGAGGLPFSKIGGRHAIVGDLSPAATFISYNYNTPMNVTDFLFEAKEILSETRKEFGWMFETNHVDKHGNVQKGFDGENVRAEVNYAVWSDVYICPHCHQEVVFWDAAVERGKGNVKDVFSCPHCKAEMTKRNSEKAFINVYEDPPGMQTRQAKQVPVLINYTYQGHRYEKKPDGADLALLERIVATKIPYRFPIVELPRGFNTQQPKDSHGITHTYMFYSRRNLIILAALWAKASRKMKFGLTNFLSRNLTRMNRFVVNSHNPNGRINGPMTGTLYVPSEQVEQNALRLFEEKWVKHGWGTSGNVITTQSCSGALNLPSESIDYLFLDPPFGANINYSELNSLWESWLMVQTNSEPEAIENEVQGKSVFDYKALMTNCLIEAHRILKSGRWITIEFSNTQSSVWNMIHSAITAAGFIVANVSVLDKKHGGIKSMAYSTAVKQDLVISAYKPDKDFVKRFKSEAATEDGVWDFICTHLEKLPVAKMKAGQLNVVPERDPKILFDKVVSYYFLNGIPIPVSAKEFQEGLRARFTEDDGMFFLPEQHAEYLKQKAKATALVQAELFVSDESSAISWLRQKLKEKPQKMQTIQPEFMQQIQAWNKYEQQLELRILLEQNFLCYDGRGPVPNPIHAYLSTQYHELRNLKDEDPELVSKAKNLWYVPDPRDAAEVEKMRERALLKEYEAYKTEKKIKTPRLEALRLGFQKSYEEHDYAMIVAIAKKLPADVVETDEKLLRYFDRAQLHLED